MAVNSGLRQSDVAAHIDRFLGFVERQPSGCWFRYSRARDNGYTTITVNGHRIGAHRFAYAAFIGDIPTGMEIDHTCRDRGCVNPDHLELVDRGENLRRRDSVTPAVFASGDLRDRIMARVETDGDCWIWTGALVRGYGVINVSKKTRYVHRLLFELDRGPIGDGLDLDHLCRIPRCVNPAHLEPVSRSVNVARMLDKQPNDRCRRGHRYDDIGKTSGGACRACWEATNQRKYKPPRPARERAEFCANGHEIAVVGRYPSGGCRACQAEKDAARGQRKDATVQRYCPQGHDLAVVGRHGTACQTCWEEGWCSNGHDMNMKGRTRGGACAQCRRDTRARYADALIERDVCPQGHVLTEVGVSAGKCKECSRQYARRKHGYVRTATDLEKVCRNGHEWTAENTRWVRRVRAGVEKMERVCRACAKERQERYEAKRAAP